MNPNDISWKTIDKYFNDNENVIVKHHKNPKYARCTKWAASRKKTTSFRLIASSSNGSSFYCLYFSTSSIFSGSTDFPRTYPTFKQRKPVLSRNSLT